MDSAGRLLKGWRCRRFAPRLVDLADGLLPSGERARLDTHLAECDDCASLPEALRQLPEQLRHAPEAPRDEAFWLKQRREIMRSIRQLPEAQPPSNWAAAMNGRRLLVPVMVLVLAVVGYWVLQARDAGTGEVVRSVAELDDATLIALAEMSGDLPEQEPVIAAVSWMTGSIEQGLSAEWHGGLDTNAEPPGWDDLSREELEELSDLIGVQLG